MNVVIEALQEFSNMKVCFYEINLSHSVCVWVCVCAHARVCVCVCVK